MTKITAEIKFDCVDPQPGGARDLGEMGGWVDGESFLTYLRGASSWIRPYRVAQARALKVAGLDKTPAMSHCTGCKTSESICNHAYWLFSDGAIANHSFRSWGDLLAALNPGKNHYMKFY